MTWKKTEWRWEYKMPKGKKAVHDLFSKKIAGKRKARKIASESAALAKRKALAEGNPDPNIPVVVDNYRTPDSLFGPHRIKKKQVEVVQRQISKAEGKPIVNAKPAEHLIHKPAAVHTLDPAAGAIEPVRKPKGQRRKNVKQETKRSSSQGTPEVGF